MDARKKILIVDDEPINLEFFDVMLSKLGFHVEKAEDGKEALDAVRRVKPDLVMLDNLMPKLTGWEVTKILKTDPAYKEFHEIPIIMFSAMDDVKDKVEGFELGIDDYITKPYNFSEVLARIRSVLRNHELIGQLEKREHRITLVEDLNNGLVDFSSNLKQPLSAIISEGKAIQAENAEVKAFTTKVIQEAENALSKIESLEATISKLRAEETKLKAMEIELKTLRSSIRRTPE